MPKAEIVRYLHEFAQTNQLPVRLCTGVRRVTRAWDGWVVQLEAATDGGADGGAAGGAWLRCKQVVMAVGGFHVPKTPAWGKELPPSLHQLQSRDYKNPQQLPPGGVVVVGSAQSGTQIAAELAEAGRDVYLCLSRSSYRVPRRVRGRDMTWWLWRTGLYDATIDDVPADKRQLKRKSPNPSQASPKRNRSPT